MSKEVDKHAGYVKEILAFPSLQRVYKRISDILTFRFVQHFQEVAESGIYSRKKRFTRGLSNHNKYFSSFFSLNN